jgi:copper transport protein
VPRTIGVAIALAVCFSVDVLGHAGLRMTNPLDGVSLGDTPSSVQLTFTERPEPSISEIHVSDRTGVRYDTGRPALIGDDLLSIAVTVRPLPAGVYTVTWRVVSSVDGHATSGTYAFGVRAEPTALTQTGAATYSILEIIGRWVFACGLVLLLGAATGYVAGFGTRDVALAKGAWVASAIGLALLTWAQQRNGSSSVAALLTTPIGRALAWRATALTVAAIALGVATGSTWRRGAMIGVGCASLAAMAVQVRAGHAAASPQPVLDVAAQWVHFAACGVWLGGLTSLLVARDPLSRPTFAAAARRFSTIAGLTIFVVAGTGLERGLNEVGSWSALLATGYGRTVLAKVSLFALVVALGATNRWRSIPRVGTNPHLLRHIGRMELACGACTIGAAAVLATLPPPVAARPTPGISVSGADFATTVRVAFSAASDQPGPNRFAVRLVDYDSGKPVIADRVALRFASLDEPDLPASSLALKPAGHDSYVGSGANLSMDGRWRITAAIQRDSNSVEVPLDIGVRGPIQQVERWPLPGGLVRYTIEIRNAGVLRFEVDPRRAGRTRLVISCLDFILDERRVSRMVVTLANAHGPARELPLTPLGLSRFASDVDLARGANVVTAVARTADGIRMRGVITVEVP